MCATTRQYSPKYLHLLVLLEKVGAVRVPSEIYRAIPKDKGKDVIDFEELRSGLPADDPVARILGEHPIGWTKLAGEEQP